MFHVNQDELLNPDKALEIILDSVPTLETEVVELAESLGRALAEDIIADSDLPPFDNSTMDGYAVIAADTTGATEHEPRRLTVLSEEPAGTVISEKVTPRTAVRIMTGAAIPTGADAVVIVEHTITPQDRESDVLIYHEVKRGENTRPAGEDVKRGEVVLRAGARIGPAEMGMLASLGKAKIRVTRKPRVALITTGNEIVDVNDIPGPGQIRDSNRYCVLGQVLVSGGMVSMFRRVSDKSGDMEQALLAAAEVSDIIITTGGVSVGRYDLVKDAITELGELYFWKIALKPGKPVVYAKIAGKPAFGLPGNPVSSMVTFDLFVRPAMLRMMGVRDINRATVPSIVQQNIKHEVGRREFVRAVTIWRENGYISTPTGSQGSGRLSSMLGANSYIIISEDRGNISAGEQLEVILWSP